MATRYVLTEHYPDTLEIRNHAVADNAVDALAEIAPHMLRNDPQTFERIAVRLGLGKIAEDTVTGYRYVFSVVGYVTP